jgi:glycosyltransferase involved in cell wall biosynthesis
MISVVIPAYQTERFIEESIRSAQTQTLPPSEIIVVDDGSSDETASLAESCGARVISKPNGGVASARNAGVSAAQHEWIAFLDADDIWERDKLESQWSAICRFPKAGFVTCNNSFFEDGKTCDDTYLDRLGDDYFKAGRTEVALGIALFERVDFSRINWIVPLPSALLVKRDVLNSIGGFDEKLNGVDDMEFYLRAMAEFPFLFIERPLVRYRQTSSSLARNHLLCSGSFLRAIEKIAAKPELYPAGVFEGALRVKARTMSHYGKSLLKAGHFTEARAVLRQTLRDEPGPATFIRWLASSARIRI